MEWNEKKLVEWKWNQNKEETPKPIDLWPGTYRVTNRDPYQLIDLIEYYKSCIGQIS